MKLFGWFRHTPPPLPPLASTVEDLWGPVDAGLRATTPVEQTLLAQRDAALQALNNMNSVPLLLDTAVRVSRELREVLSETESAVERIRAAKDRLEDLE